MRKVSQANLKTKEAVLNGQSKFITCSMEMPVPYSFHDIEAKVWSEKNLTKCVAVTQGDEAYL